MAIHKGKRDSSHAEAALAAAPLLCLAMFVLGVPFPLPRFFVPGRGYELAAGPGSTAADVMSDAAAGPFGTVRLHIDGRPTKVEISAARRHYRDTGMPVAFETTANASSDAGPAEAFSIPLRTDGSAVELTILLDEASAGLPVRVLVDGSAAFDTQELPPDRRVKVPIEAGDPGRDALVEVRAGAGGADRVSRFSVAAGGGNEPRILMAGGEAGTRTLLDSLFAVKHIRLDELESAGVFDYELVVLDGPRLSSLGASLSARLASYVERGAGSLLLVADSPGIGIPGDAPELERLLPAELSPRPQSRLPDVAMAVAIDASGSMYGEKLSLAKAVGLELVANLKPGDVAGILLFDEEARWLSFPGPVELLDARRELEPLRAGGGTRIYPALAECIDALERFSQPERRIIIVSDGVSKPADFDSLVSRAFKARIAVSTMAVGDEYDKALLTSIAAGSGGRFYRVRDPMDVPSLIMEDRQTISRMVFAEESVGIVDIAGSPAGNVTGMARLSPKPDALVFFSTEAGDPLFASRRIGSRSAIVYASDIHGRYGSGFLGRPENLAVIKAVIEGSFRGRPPQATLAETADGISLSIHGDYLAAPRAILVDPLGAIVGETAFEALAPGYFHAAFDPPAEGRYTLLVADRGTVAARFPIHANRGLKGVPVDSAAADAAYRTPFWALMPGKIPWLLAFFALSLLYTLLARMRRRG